MHEYMLNYTYDINLKSIMYMFHSLDGLYGRACAVGPSGQASCPLRAPDPPPPGAGDAGPRPRAGPLDVSPCPGAGPLAVGPHPGAEPLAADLPHPAVEDEHFVRRGQLLAGVPP